MISQMDDKNLNVINENPGKISDFSIEHILKRAGNDLTKNTSDTLNFQWLQCSRYCPPKVPRIHKKDGLQKRQLGRHPRIPFTSYQLSILEKKFQQSPYLSSEEVSSLSQKLQLADIRVKIWFQNRRARERREKHCPTRKEDGNSTSTDEVKVTGEMEDGKNHQGRNLLFTTASQPVHCVDSKFSNNSSSVSSSFSTSINNNSSNSTTTIPFINFSSLHFDLPTSNFANNIVRNVFTPLDFSKNNKGSSVASDLSPLPFGRIGQSSSSNIVPFFMPLAHLGKSSADGQNSEENG